VVQLEEEVRRLRQRLQTTTDEFVRANEEVKSANEELQSINEEYHSTTEELETSKEELQSVNEELQTVNSELKNKLDVISEAHSDMENFIASTNFATLFLNRELRIERYTPATTELFNILPGDIGRPISHLTNKLDYENLTEDAVQVLKNLTPVEREVQDSKGHYLILKVRPYRTSDHRIDGVILTFVDITNRKKSELALQLREQELAALNKTLETRVKERTDELRLEKEYNSNIVDTICPSS
jgi:two-component system CheB/CheR fusion protein